MRWFSHKGLIAIEAMLVLGLVKDVVAARVGNSTLPDYGKVLFIMAVTIGLFGGLFVIVQQLSERGIEKAHEVARALPLPFAYWLAHAALLLGLYFLYAHMHGIQPF
jgi:hypothetical protein